MNRHSFIQTACLIVLAMAAVYSAIQLNKIYADSVTAKVDASATTVRAERLKLRGEARLAADDSELGMSYLAAALELNPDDLTLQTRIATLRAQTVINRPMLVSAQSAMQLQVLFESVLDASAPKSPDIRIALGKVLTVRGRHDEAASILDSVIKEYPNSASGLLFRADVSLQKGEWSIGLGTLKRAKALDEDNPLIDYGLGLALSAQEQNEPALIAFTQAAQTLSIADVWLKVGNTAALLKKWAVAESAFQKAERIQELSTSASVLYAQTLAQRGKLEQAIQAASLRAKRTGDIQSYADMSNWYLELKQFENAVPILMELRKVRAKEADFDCKLGYAWENLKDLNKALAFFEQCKRKSDGIKTQERIFNFAQQKVLSMSSTSKMPMSPTTPKASSSTPQ